MNEELFTLCKRVYEATGWKYTIGRFHDDGSYDGYVGHKGVAYTPSPQVAEWLPKDIPLYTSDYLLQKLPSVVQDPYDKIFRHIQMWINGDSSAHAGYVEPYAHDDRVAYAQKSDEMRITLLKLTLKLHEDKLL